MQNPDRLVTRDELQSAVWGGRVVEDGNLQKAISALRKALQVVEGRESFIVTVPGRGFRFGAPVVFEPEAHSVVATSGSFESGGAVCRLAKLSPPRLPATVARVRLFTVLQRYRERKIIWVSGPPGAGKTTLVRSFLDDAGTPCLWYLVDSGDSDPASFFYYLREAVRDAGAQGAPLPLLTAEYLQDIAGYTRRFFRALIATLPQHFVLVLDNFQDAGGAPVLDEILRDAAGELGPGAAIYVISRQEPPAVFARLRANQELALVGWDALRLTEAETGAIVARQLPQMAALAGAMHARAAGPLA